MKDLKSLTKKAINQFIGPLGPDSYGWPPACNTILYQPERPVYVKENETEIPSTDE